MFSSRVLARSFLRRGDLGPEWRVRGSHSAELVSLLLKPCMQVMLLLPNPLPEPLVAEDALLNLLLRVRFLRLLLARGQGRPGLRLPREMSYDVSVVRRSRRGSEVGS